MPSMSAAPPHHIVHALMSWYEAKSRDLPWRKKGQDHPDPYGVWISEIMLQQTTVAAVLDYYARFMTRFPTLASLSAAPLEDVLVAWQGLGYYSRARNLHKAALHITAHFGGAFPVCERDLLSLPGVGPYTAAAIAAMAYNAPTLPVDGNVARVFARLFCLDTPLPKLLDVVRTRVHAFTNHGPHHGDVAQALMDLGATVCTPTSPSCDACPLNKLCQGYSVGDALSYPVKAPSKKTPHKWATAFVMQNEKGDLYLRKRPDTGLLASLMEVPTTPWTSAPDQCTPLPVEAAWQELPTPIIHVFTHFKLTVTVKLATHVTQDPALSGQWVPLEDLTQHPLPTLMTKIIKSAHINYL